jgi:predicted type IV restriction endonuclease
MRDELIKAINEIRGNSSLLILDEASIKAAIILRFLSLLGWNPFDINEVRPEYTIESKRVDQPREPNRGPVGPPRVMQALSS